MIEQGVFRLTSDFSFSAYYFIFLYIIGFHNYITSCFDVLRRCLVDCGFLCIFVRFNHKNVL